MVLHTLTTVKGGEFWDSLESEETRAFVFAFVFFAFGCLVFAGTSFVVF